MTESLKILVAVSNREFGSYLKEKTVAKLSSVPIEFDIVHDGNSALSEMKVTKHCLAYIDHALPGLAGVELAQNILSANAETQVVFCLKDGETAETGFAHLRVPVVDWDIAIDNLASNLPVDFQVTYGLKKTNVDLYRKLEEHVRSYKRLRTDKPVEVISLLATSHDSAVFPEHTPPRAPSTHATNSTPDRLQGVSAEFNSEKKIGHCDNPELSTNVATAPKEESLVLGSCLVTFVAVCFMFRDEEPHKNPVVWLSGLIALFSVAGFFGLRILLQKERTRTKPGSL